MPKREGEIYVIDGGIGDNPKLKGQRLNDGRVSLYLEYYFGYIVVESSTGKQYKKGNRRCERLGLYIWDAPRNAKERQHNKETLMLAKRQRFEKAQELLEHGEGYRLKMQVKNIDMLKWMWSYYEDYIKGDKRNIKRAYTCFVNYLVDPDGKLEDEVAMERIALLTLKPKQIDKTLVCGFVEYLKRHYKGEGSHTVFARFKKMMKAAVEQGIMLHNPCEGIIIKRDNGQLRKDVLSVEEIRRLIATHYAGENPEIRRAFIFCLYTGIRWCDIIELTFANVDYSNKLLQFEQAKTKGHSSKSGVVIPLNAGLLKLIGKGEREQKIFSLPSHTMCLKALRHWTSHAHIDKHITWHCARHSFAVNILNNGANIKTVASLLGHSDISMTEKYTRAIDSLKEAAINSLPELNDK